MNRLIIFLKWCDYYLQKILPNFISSGFRRISSAFITPFHFSYATGHFWSSLLKKSINKKGSPIPWYTYSLISYLEGLDFNECTVLEIGAGNSSYWWAERAKQVISLESDRKWYDKLTTGNTFGNLKFRFLNNLSSNNLLNEFEDLKSSTYDIVILDGMDRLGLMSNCLEMLSPRGILIADDTDRYDYSTILEGTGINKIDFHGYSPSVVLPKTSSIYFYQSCNLLLNYER